MSVRFTGGVFVEMIQDTFFCGFDIIFIELSFS